jgi:hypothetical protein
MRLIIDMAGCMLDGHGVKEAGYYESRMSVLEGSAWHSPVDLPIHPATRLVVGNQVATPLARLRCGLQLI